MYHCRLCTRLHTCISLHPPAVVFFLCLALLSATFLSYGLYIQTHDVRDADFTQDWNMFFQALGSLKVCPYGNETGGAHFPSLAGHMPDLFQATSETTGSVSTLVVLNLLPWTKISNHGGLQVFVTGRQLGMRGPSIDSTVTVTVITVEKLAVCNLTSMECPVKACVSVTGLRSLLPRSRAPTQCPTTNLSSAELLHLLASKSEITGDCYRVGYNRDPELETIIPQEERTACSVRLLTMALSLFLIALSFILLSCFCFQPSKDKRVLGHL